MRGRPRPVVRDCVEPVKGPAIACAKAGVISGNPDQRVDWVVRRADGADRTVGLRLSFDQKSLDEPDVLRGRV